ncbi:unnamed protein product, partial [Rotaria magnacalcarata]
RKTINVVEQSTTNYDVLLVYVYADTHPYAHGNLEYFIRTAVRENDGVNYFIIIQELNNKSRDDKRFPLLPLNARYVYHENKCFDLGTVGWFLRSGFVTTLTNNIVSHDKLKKTELKISSYKYFIFMNSSIRGPFFPPYYSALVKAYQSETKTLFYWYSVFTQRLKNKSYLIVTDLTGMLLLLNPKDGKDVFGCYNTLWDVTVNNELAISARILSFGFWIDSLQTKYQGIDFSNIENRNCNGGKNPYFDDNVDGITLDPYEVVFVKYNYKNYSQAADRAAVYQNWTLRLGSVAK